MNERRHFKGEKPKRIRLSDGSFAVDMGETGKGQVREKANSVNQENLISEAKKTESVSQNNINYTGSEEIRPEERYSSNTEERRKGFSGYAISSDERREIEQRRRAIYEAKIRKIAADKKNATKMSENKKLYKIIFGKIYMRWMAFSVDISDLFKGGVIGVLILVFVMLQTTVFTNIKPFGAVPDLMLSFVCAVGVTEGERWGGVTGLICAVLSESVGGYGLTLLPLLYVLVGYIAGILGAFYFRDSVPVRAIYSACAGVLKCFVTVICTYYAYGEASFALVLTEIVIPEYFSTLLMSTFPHAVTFFALKVFHKSRAERVK